MATTVSQELTTPVVAEGVTLDSRVGDRALADPAAVALRHRGGATSYGQLWSRSGQWARALHDAGVRPGDRVAVCLPRTPDLVAALLGVLRTGAAYVPLDPDYPAQRTAYLVQDSDARLVICDDSTTAVVGDAPRLLPPAPDAPALPDTAPGAAQPHDLAYVIYTSGSTGRPKGVAIEHRHTDSLLDWAHRTYGEHEWGGVLGSTSVCFDLSVFEIFATLAAGGTLVLADSALDLATMPDRDAVRLVNTVPSAMSLLVREGMVPAGVVTVNLAGEPLPRRLADAVHGLGHVRRLLNLYGPSEDTTYSTWAEVPARETTEPTIGRPLPGTRAYVLDEHRHPVEPGATGELWLAGAGVARGYLGRDDLTAERFLPDPLVPGERMYRTGDLVRERPDGELAYRGRVDHQVKVRGHRVELGEIESVLREEPGISGAVVDLRDSAGEQQLVAFVEAQHPGAVAAATDRVARRLPDYMQPNAVVVLDALPLTPNGKVDRGALPATAPPPATPTGAAPATDQERVVADLWADVLELTTPPGVDLTFAALGGSSLTAAAVLHRLSARTGRRLPLHRFPVTSTVRDLAVALDEAEQAPEQALTAVTDDTFPGSPLQAEFVILDELTEGRSAVSVMSVHARVTGGLDHALLQRALDALVVRHEALRTAVLAQGDGVVCRVLAPAPVPLRVVGSLAELHEAATSPIPLASGRLLEVLSLPGSADEDHHLLLRAHHAACDGWSIGVMLRELAELYAAAERGTEPPPAPPTGFASVARWLADRRAEHRDVARAYWRERMAGVSAEQLLPPTAAPGAAPPPLTGGYLRLPIDADLSRALDERARSAGLTAYSLISAITAVRLHRETGERAHAFRIPVSTRRHPDLESMIGPFIETAPTRVDIVGDPTVRELAADIAERALTDLEHSWTGMGDCQVLPQLARDAHGAHVGGMVVAVQNYASAEHVAGARRWSYACEPDNGGAKVDLSVFWELGAPDGAVLGLEYTTARHDAEGVRRYGEQFLTLLREALADLDAPVSRLRLTGDQERERYAELNAHDLVAPETTVPERVLAAARRTPDRVALDCPRRGSVTYAELVRRAVALARDLGDAAGGGAGGSAGERAGGSAGDGADRADHAPRPVAVAARRSADVVIGQLAAWWAGRPYLPLDPAHPPARLDTVLRDSGATDLVVDDALPEQVGAGLRRHRAWTSGVASDEATDVASDAFAEPSVAALPEPLVDPALDDLAYLIYTSGSTGIPKGVRVGHRALAAFLDAMTRVLPLAAGDAVLAATTPSFDISGLETWHPLAAGARVVVATEEQTRDGFALAGRIADGGATLVQLTPSGWRLLLDAQWAGRPGLRALIGAEPVPPGTAARLLPLVGELWNVYGPTEATIWASAHRIRPEDTTGSVVPIGRPLGHARVHLLDHAGHPVPPGTPGLLHLSGPCLAEGYHDRDDLTGAAFTTATHLEGSPRIYRTGDRGRLRADGLLECLGRIDNQVKVRGVRIELEEVDQALRTLPGVSAAAATVTPDREGDPVLVGYVVTPDPLPPVTELVAHLGSSLPAAMVPTLFHRVERLPLGPSGKVDRAALPMMEPAVDGEAGADHGAGAGGRGGVVDAPMSDLEELVADVWRDHLPVERLGPSSSFFGCGGHSLSATRVVASLRSELELELPVAALFRRPVLRDFALEVERLLLADEQAGDR